METTGRFPPSGGESSFRMIDVGGKAETRRRAVARGTIVLRPEAYRAVRERRNPKGDVLALAEVAGILAVKRVPEAIPLCHSLPIEHAGLRFEFSDDRCAITVFCEAQTTGKTGVEMEALAGVNGALLSIYDLSKAVDPVITLSDIRLDTKEGGKSGRWAYPDYVEPAASVILSPHRSDLSGVPAGVLVVSDRAARGESRDTSGARLEDYLRVAGARWLDKAIVPDEPEAIRREVGRLTREHGALLLLVTGGTGMSPRDVTPEALAPLWTKRLPGIGELLRSSGARSTATAWISRSEAGLVGETLVVLLPGSEKAVREAIEVLDPILAHLLEVVRGGARHAHA